MMLYNIFLKVKINFFRLKQKKNSVYLFGRRFISDMQGGGFAHKCVVCVCKGFNAGGTSYDDDNSELYGSSAQ